jgi:hypothetical protein
MRSEEGFQWLEAISAYVSRAEFPRLHDFILNEHFEAVLGAETIKEIDYLTLGVIRHNGRTGDEITAATNLREYCALG